jgi:hypothetical protein
MSAATVLHAAVLAHLKATCRVFDAPTARAAIPVAVLGEAVLGVSDATGVSGRTGTIAVDYVDTGESPARLRALVGAVEAAAAGVPRSLGRRVAAHRAAADQEPDPARQGRPLGRVERIRGADVPNSITGE